MKSSYSYRSSQPNDINENDHDHDDDGIITSQPTLMETVRQKCGIGFLVLSVIGFAFVLAGLVLAFETSSDGTRVREQGVRKYQQAIEAWNTRYRDLFSGVSISIASLENPNATLLEPIHYGDILADQGRELHSYPLLRYQSRVFLFPQPSILSNPEFIQLTIVSKLPGKMEHRENTNLTIMFLQEVTVPMSNTLCNLIDGSVIIDATHCKYEIQLRDVCIRMILINDTYWSVDDGHVNTYNTIPESLPPATPGCYLGEKSNRTWGYGEYMHGVKNKETTFNISVRAVYDPYLVAQALTDASLWFGLPVSEKVLLSLIFIIIGGVLLVPAGIIFLHYWRSWHRAKHQHLHDTYEMPTVSHEHEHDETTPRSRIQHTSFDDPLHDQEEVGIGSRNSMSDVTHVLASTLDVQQDPEIVTPSSPARSPPSRSPISVQTLRVATHISPRSSISPISSLGPAPDTNTATSSPWNDTKNRSNRTVDSSQLFVISDGDGSPTDDIHQEQCQQLSSRNSMIHLQDGDGDGDGENDTFHDLDLDDLDAAGSGSTPSHSHSRR